MFYFFLFIRPKIKNPQPMMFCHNAGSNIFIMGIFWSKLSRYFKKHFEKNIAKNTDYKKVKNPLQIIEREMQEIRSIKNGRYQTGLSDRSGTEGSR